MKKPIPWWAYLLWFITGALVGWVMLETAGYGILHSPEWYIVVIPLAFLIPLAVWPVTGNRAWFAAIGGLAVLPAAYAAQTTNSPDGRVCQNFGSTECVQLYAPASFVLLTVILLLVSAALIFFTRSKATAEPGPKAAKAPKTPKPAKPAKSKAAKPGKDIIEPTPPPAVEPADIPSLPFAADSIFREPGPPPVIPAAPDSAAPEVEVPVAAAAVPEPAPEPEWTGAPDTSPAVPPTPAEPALPTGVRPSGIGQRPSGVGQRPMTVRRRPKSEPDDTATGDLPLAVPEPLSALVEPEPEPVAEPTPEPAPEPVAERPAEPRVFQARMPRASWPDLNSIRQRPAGRKPVAATAEVPVEEPASTSAADAPPTAAQLGWDLPAPADAPEVPGSAAAAPEVVPPEVSPPAGEFGADTPGPADTVRPSARPARHTPAPTYDSSAIDLVNSIFDAPDPKPVSTRRPAKPAAGATKRPAASDSAEDVLQSELSKIRELLPEGVVKRPPAQPAASPSDADRLAEIEENLARMRDMISKSE
jgi:hypothetical protein